VLPRDGIINARLPHGDGDASNSLSPFAVAPVGFRFRAEVPGLDQAIRRIRPVQRLADQPMVPAGVTGHRPTRVQLFRYAVK
jgi:hypothetical protein